MKDTRDRSFSRSWRNTSHKDTYISFFVLCNADCMFCKCTHSSHIQLGSYFCVFWCHLFVNFNFIPTVCAEKKRLQLLHTGMFTKRKTAATFLLSTTFIALHHNVTGHVICCRKRFNRRRRSKRSMQSDLPKT